MDEVLSAQHAVAWRLSADKNVFEATPLFERGQAETSNLYLVFASGIMKLFQDGFIGARMLSVLPSLLSILLLFALASYAVGRREALLAALLLSVSHWAAHNGRDGWDQVAMNMLQIATLSALVRGIGQNRLGWSALAGVLLGACLYTYVASRLVFLQVAVWLAWEAIASSPKRRIWIHAGICLAIALTSAAPYYHYLLTKSAGGFNVRVNQLAFGGEGKWQTLMSNIVAHLAMFNFRGGTYARDNLPGWPMLDPITGIMFILGLVIIFTRHSRFSRLLITWLMVCLLGGILSQSREGPPYVYRVANLAPWACLVAAIGAIAAWDRLRPRLPKPASIFGAVAVLCMVGVVNYWILFVRSPACPDFGPAFGTSETQIGLWLKKHPDARPCYVYYPVVHCLDQYRPTLWYPNTNGYNWYRPPDSAACIHLSAGIYRRTPERALDSVALRGDIDLVARLPDHLLSPAVFVVPADMIDQIREFYVIDGQEDLRDSLNRNLGTIVYVRPR